MSAAESALGELLAALRGAVADEDCPVLQPLEAWANAYRGPRPWWRELPNGERLYAALVRADEAVAEQLVMELEP